jgi:hypothetical protein
VNLWEDPAAADELREAGLRGVPVVRVGEHLTLGLDAARVDELLGLDRDTSAAAYSGEELLDRSALLLGAAARFARELPPEHYDDETPRPPGVEGPVEGMRLPDGRPVLFPDGSPYVPHPTYLGLVRHLAGHGTKLLYLAQDPAVPLYAQFEPWVPFGEPDPSWRADDVLDRLDEVVRELRALVAAPQPNDYTRIVTAYDGRRHAVRDGLQANTYSIAQHTRQLMDLLERVGVEPEQPLRSGDYEGLGVPARVWE